MSYSAIEHKKEEAKNWFYQLRDTICQSFEQIEQEADSQAFFERKQWHREGGGGGEISLMRGKIFEKVGVNVSTVYGTFAENFAKEIPGCEQDSKFWACGISLVAHMQSPFVPAVHMNTRMICTSREWFGGGTDLTPTFPIAEDTEHFHQQLKLACDKFDASYYPRFKEGCEKYFFLPHRNEMRGVGGIFYDYLNTGDWEQDFGFTQEVGNQFLHAFLPLVKKRMWKEWDEEHKKAQLLKRGRYVEFNLLYDRGTRFGLMTGGNTEAILMSLPPEVNWL